MARAPAASGDALPEEKRDLRFHDLRHTAASLMVSGGIPLFDVGEILGHKDPKTTKRYAHFAPESGRRAIDALAAALTTKAASAH